MLAWAAEQLLAGVEGSLVVEKMRGAYALSSLSANLSLVRGMVMERYPSDVALPFEEEGVAAFLAAPLKEKVRLQREHARSPSWSTEAEAALAKLALLPPNMDSFRLKKEESETLLGRQEAAQLAKNGATLLVEGGALLDRAVLLLLNAREDSPFPSLALPLLLVSGRRLTEICGRSSFAPSEHPLKAVFAGQLKKRERGLPYEIPLLCPYKDFARAFDILKRKQGDVSQLTNQEVKRRYQAWLGREVRRVLPVPARCTVHTLRAAYASFVCELYSSEKTSARVTMQVLGHEKLKESLSYNNVVLTGMEGKRGAYGRL